MLTLPQTILLICVLAALWGWEWWEGIGKERNDGT